jgi:hypothetical protein
VFDLMPPSNFEVPVIRNGSPYMSEEETRYILRNEEKMKWIGRNDFKSSFGKATV